MTTRTRQTTSAEVATSQPEWLAVAANPLVTPTTGSRIHAARRGDHRAACGAGDHGLVPVTVLDSGEWVAWTHRGIAHRCLDCTRRLRDGEPIAAPSWTDDDRARTYADELALALTALDGNLAALARLDPDRDARHYGSHTASLIEAAADVSMWLHLTRNLEANRAEARTR